MGLLYGASSQSSADYRERGHFRDKAHPHLEQGVVGEAWHARTGRLAPPEARPAPLPGEQSAEVLRDWLGLDAVEIQALVDAGVVEPTDPAVYTAIAKCGAEFPGGQGCDVHDGKRLQPVTQSIRYTSPGCRPQRHTHEKGADFHRPLSR